MDRADNEAVPNDLQVILSHFFFNEIFWKIYNVDMPAEVDWVVDSAQDSILAGGIRFLVAGFTAVKCLGLFLFLNRLKWTFLLLLLFRRVDKYVCNWGRMVPLLVLFCNIFKNVHSEKHTNEVWCGSHQCQINIIIKHLKPKLSLLLV